jgi:YfiH family protein
MFSSGPAARIMANWLAFGAAQHPEFTGIAIARQVHGSRIELHDQKPLGWRVLDGIDGHLTTVPGLLLTVTVADCIPVYLAHSGSGTVALLHAGWRGIADGIIESGIKAVTQAGECQPDEIRIHCGVGICGTCYEVGSEVLAAVSGQSSSSPGRLDLRLAAAERAGRLGVRDATISSWCSSHDADRFFSHRRSRGAEGRMVAYLGIPAPR